MLVDDEAAADFNFEAAAAGTREHRGETGLSRSCTGDSKTFKTLLLLNSVICTERATGDRRWLRSRRVIVRVLHEKLPPTVTELGDSGGLNRRNE